LIHEIDIALCVQATRLYLLNLFQSVHGMQRKLRQPPTSRLNWYVVGLPNLTAAASSVSSAPVRMVEKCMATDTQAAATGDPGAGQAP